MNIDLEKYGFKEISHIGEGRYFYHIYAYDPYNKGDKTLTFTLNENPKDNLTFFSYYGVDKKLRDKFDLDRFNGVINSYFEDNFKSFLKDLDNIIKIKKENKTMKKNRMTEKEESIIDKIQDLIDNTEWLSDISFDMDESDISSADDIVNYLENGINEIEVIYYDNALKILSKNDPSLQISMGYADDLGYRCKDINSELLATILCQESAREELYDIRDDIEEIVDEWLESDEDDE